MTGQTPAHQIVFRWTARGVTGGAGVGPVAWSGSRDMFEPVHRCAAQALRVSGEAARPSMARMELPRGLGFDDAVLLIRRIPDRDRNERPSTCCHALLGSASWLTPAFCLALHRWDWPGSGLPLREVEGESLGRVSVHSLREAAAEAVPELDREVRALGDPLVVLVAEALRRPGHRISLLDRSGGHGPVPLLWGVRRALGRALPGSWSFATHDTRDTGPFRFVFVPEWPVSAGQDRTLTRLDPARAERGDRAHHVAERLIARYLEIQPDRDEVRHTQAELYKSLRDLGACSPDKRLARLDETLYLLDRGSGRRSSSRQVPSSEQPYESYEPSTAPEQPAKDNDRMAPENGALVRSGPDRAQEPPAPPVPAAGERTPRPARAITAPVLSDALRTGKDLAEHLPRAGDTALLDVLDHGIPIGQATQVVNELISRADEGTLEQPKAVCSKVLSAHFYLDWYPDPAWVKDAVRVYHHLVRPYCEQVGFQARLADILPRLWEKPSGMGREVLERIIRDDSPTGFGDAGWKALFAGVAPEGPGIAHDQRSADRHDPGGRHSMMRGDTATAYRQIWSALSSGWLLVAGCLMFITFALVVIVVRIVTA